MTGSDDHVISMYARGMSVRELRDLLGGLSSTTKGHDLVTTFDPKSS
jgi:transposase-like protein